MNIDCKVLLVFNWLMDFKTSPMQLSCPLGLKVHYFHSLIRLRIMLPTSHFIYIYIHPNHHRLASA